MSLSTRETDKLCGAGLTVAGVLSRSSTGVPAGVTHNRAIGTGGEEERAWGADSAARSRSNGTNSTCCGENIRYPNFIRVAVHGERCYALL